MVTARHQLTVDPDNALVLAVDAGKDSVAPGTQVTYALTYGNRSSGTITGTTLVFPIPEGTAVVASSGGTVNGRSVNWNLGSVLAGTGGRRTVTLAVPSTPPPAGLRLLVDSAQLSGNSAVTGAELARANAVTRVMAGNPLGLTIVSLAPGPVSPSGTLTATLRVTNSGPVPLIGVVLIARVPSNGVNSFSQSALSNSGTCPGTGCDPSEIATWNLGTLVAGASTTVTMPMVVYSGTGLGRLISLEAYAGDDSLDQAVARATVMVGSNFSPSPGLSYNGDFDGNGAVNFADLALLNSHFGSNDPRYDLNGDGVVNFGDLAIFKALFGR